MRVEAHDTTEQLRESIRQSSEADERDRMRMVLFAMEGETGASIAERLGCTDRVVRKWIQRYNEGGLAGLRDLPRSGRPRHLEASRDEALRQRLDEGAKPEDEVCALRGEDVRRILEEEFGARYTLSGTYVVLHRLGFSSLMPRPRHPKADAAAQEEFQKNSPGDGARHRSHASRRQDPGLGAG
jgi:putative transposase